ncbi:hypothetical protein PQR66_27755 [Paraburkholderia agricolaris]|uniref:Uncharacterized protein n=1 Tax=Paraburkholderia agricolaris TaxID=2152888 RepID=A0ABW8ZWD9_9BURK
MSEQRRRHDKIVEPWTRHMSPTKMPAQQNTLVMRAHTWRFALIRDAALMSGPDKKIVLVTPRAG